MAGVCEREVVGVEEEEGGWVGWVGGEREVEAWEWGGRRMGRGWEGGRYGAG